MDLLLRLLFYGGKYLSKLTAESMTVGGRLRGNIERFPIGGSQESMMDLYSQNMNEMGGYCGGGGRRGRLHEDDYYRTSRIGRMSLPNFVDEQYRNIERKIKYDSIHTPQGRSRRGRPRRRKAKSTIAPKRTYQEIQHREEEFVQKKELLRKFSQVNFAENHARVDAMKRRKTLPLIDTKPMSREEAGRLQRKNELEFKKFEVQLEERIYSDRLRAVDVERLGEVGIDEEVVLRRLQSVGDWRSRVCDKNLQSFAGFEETLGRLDDTFRLLKNREAFLQLEQRLVEDRRRRSAKSDDLAFKAFLSRLEDVRVRKGRTRRFMEKVSREFEAYRRDLGSAGMTKKLEVKELFERMLVTETKVYVPESVECKEFAVFMGPTSRENDDGGDAELWGRINRTDVEEPIVRSSRKVFGLFEGRLGDRDVQKKMSKIKEELPILPDLTPKLKKPRFHIPVINDMRPVETVRCLPLRKPLRCYNSAHTLHNSLAKDRTRPFSTNHPNFEKNVREIVQHKIASNIFFAEPKRRVSGLMPNCLAKFKKVVTRYRFGSTTKQSPLVLMYERSGDRCDLPIWDRSEFPVVDCQTCSGDVLEVKANVGEELQESTADQKNMYQRILDTILQQQVVAVKVEAAMEPVVIKECKDFILGPSNDVPRKESVTRKSKSLQVMPSSKTELIPCVVEAVKVEEEKKLPSSQGSFRKFKRPETAEPLPKGEQKDKGSEKNDDWECVMSSSHHFMPKPESSNLALRQFLRGEGKVEAKKPHPVRTANHQQNVHKFLQSAEKITAKFKVLDKINDTNWSKKCEGNVNYKNVAVWDRKQDNVAEGSRPLRHHKKIARAESAKEHKSHHVKHAKKVHAAEDGHRLKHRKKEHKSEHLKSDETAASVRTEAIMPNLDVSKSKKAHKEKVPFHVQQLEVKSSHGKKAALDVHQSAAKSKIVAGKGEAAALDVCQSPLKPTDQVTTFDKLREVFGGDLHQSAVKSLNAASKGEATTLEVSQSPLKSTGQDATLDKLREVFGGALHQSAVKSLNAGEGEATTLEVSQSPLKSTGQDATLDKLREVFDAGDCNAAGNVIGICCEEDWTPDVGTQIAPGGQNMFPGDVLDEFIMEMDALKPQTVIADEVGRLGNFETAFEQEIGMSLEEDALKKDVVEMRGPPKFNEERREEIKKVDVTKIQASSKLKDKIKINLNEGGIGTSNKRENLKASPKEELSKMNVAAAQPKSTPLKVKAKASLEEEISKRNVAETRPNSTPLKVETKASLEGERSTKKPTLKFKNIATKKIAIEEKATPVHRAEVELKEEILKLQDEDLLERRTVELLQEEMTNSLIEDIIGTDVQEIRTSQDLKLASLRELLKNDVPEVIKPQTNVKEDNLKNDQSDKERPEVETKLLTKGDDKPLQTNVHNVVDEETIKMQINEIRKNAFAVQKPDVNWKKFGRFVAMKNSPIVTFGQPRKDDKVKEGDNGAASKTAEVEETKKEIRLEMRSPASYRLNRIVANEDRRKENDRKLASSLQKVDAKRLDGLKLFGIGKDVKKSRSREDARVKEEEKIEAKKVEVKLVPPFGPKGVVPKKDVKEESKGEERLEGLKIKEVKLVPLYGPKGVALKKDAREESKGEEMMEGLKIKEAKLVPLYGPKGVALKKDAAKEESKGKERLEGLKIRDKQVEVKQVSVLKGKKYAREESKGEERMEELKVKEMQVEEKRVPLLKGDAVKKEDTGNEQKAEGAKIKDKKVEVKQGSLYGSGLQKDVAKNYAREVTRNEDGLEEIIKQAPLYGSKGVGLQNGARDGTRNEEKPEETTDAKVAVEESKSNGSLDDMWKAVLVKMEGKTAAKKAEAKPASSEAGLKKVVVKGYAKENLAKDEDVRGTKTELKVELDCGSQHKESTVTKHPVKKAEPTKILLSEIEESKIATPSFAQRVDDKVESGDNTRKLVLSKIEEIKDISERLVLAKVDDDSSKIEQGVVLRPKSALSKVEKISPNQIKESKSARPSSSSQVYQLLGKPRTGEIKEGNTKKLVLCKVEGAARPTFAAKVDELLNVSGAALAKCGKVAGVLDPSPEKRSGKVVAEGRYSGRVVDEEEVKKEDLKVAVNPTKCVVEVETTSVETVKVEQVVDGESGRKYGRIDEALAGKIRASAKGYADKHKSIEELLGAKRTDRPEQTASKEDLLKGLQRNVRSAKEVGRKFENLFTKDSDKPTANDSNMERRSPPEKIINIHCKIGLAEIEPVLAALNEEIADKTVRKVASLKKLRGRGHSKFDKPTEQFITVHEMANMDEVGVKFYSDVCNAKPRPLKLAKPAKTYKPVPLKLPRRNDSEDVIKTTTLDLDRIIKPPKKGDETFVSLKKQFQFSGPLKIFASSIWNNEAELTLPRSAERMEKAAPPPPAKVEVKKVYNKYKYETKMVKTSLGKTMPVTFLVREAAGSP